MITTEYLYIKYLLIKDIKNNSNIKFEKFVFIYIIFKYIIKYIIQVLYKIFILIKKLKRLTLKILNNNIF